MGIGGIAIALALQNILSDLFSSISIYLDKPFKVGDFVEIGGQSGFVREIHIFNTMLDSPDNVRVIIR